MFRNIIRRYPVWSFLCINYLISWVFLYPSYQIILEHESISPLALIGLIGAYGPSIAAVIIQWILDKSRLKALLFRVIQFRISWKILAFIIVFPLLIYIACYGFSLTLYGIESEFNLLNALSNLMIWFLLALPFGPMGEELGWRGFMLPRLMEKFSIFRSTILVGLAWGVWHMASFTFPGAAIPSFLPVNLLTIGLYFLNTIGLSFIFTYVFLKTDGSVFYAIILHAFFNTSANVAVDLFGESKELNIQLLSYCLNFILAGLLGLYLIKHNSDNTGNQAECIKP